MKIATLLNRIHSMNQIEAKKKIENYTRPKILIFGIYRKCPKISYTRMSEADSADPNQTAPDQGLLCLPFH